MQAVLVGTVLRFFSAVSYFDLLQTTVTVMLKVELIHVEQRLLLLKLLENSCGKLQTLSTLVSL